ncbi:class IV adenylate cyclase [candidate division KSB1 bacterium]|nr:class IV adenylate cyclase [candidate division KSB1 bacterium]
MPTNIEIKAKTNQPVKIVEILQAHNAVFKGEDHQVDTYFRVPNGRLKLREGTIEQYLIHYHRCNQAGPKQSDVLLYACPAGSPLKAVLTEALGELVVVDKHRKIFFIDNVKFHVDNVQQLGAFVEIEAIDVDGSISVNRLNEQCQFYMELLSINHNDLIEVSYSDMLLGLQ